MLLLFDIDGTLIRERPLAHQHALADALRETVGVDIGDTDSAWLAAEPWGKTDRQILRELVDRHRPGRPAEEEELDRAQARAIELHDASERPLLTGHDQELTETALLRLRDAGHLLALLTGNLEPIARRKMALCGLAELFPPGQGAFGSDAERRTEFVPIALARAGSAETPYPTGDTVLIGDTPRDVEAAQAGAVRCIAVRGERYSEADLLAAGADAVVPSVIDVERVLAGWARPTP